LKAQLFQQMASKGATTLIRSHQYDVVAGLCDNLALLKGCEILFNRTIPELVEKANITHQNAKNPVN